MTPDQHDLWFLPLGGTGEIGMNLNLYGHDGHWLMVDCGVTFPRPGRVSADGRVHHSGEPPVQMADPAFIADRRDQLAGLVITHAHEDHIGALPYLWPMLQCPVYTSRFTAEILRRKLAEFDLLERVPIHVVEVDERRQIGPFNVQWLALTHSIPDPNALVIRTPAGTVFHSGDWKLDAQPLVGHGYSPWTFRDLQGEELAAMISDSSNAEVQGHSGSEASLFEGLAEAIGSAPGRVVVACFGSNIARLHTLAKVAQHTGRHMGLLGRSLHNMSGAARAAGLWNADDHLINPSHLGYLPRNHVLAVATGSQGEPRTALMRLAANSHPDLELQAGDRGHFTARAIPGNEPAIDALTERLRSQGIEVLTAQEARLPIHVSGHPASEELETMYRWVRPQLSIPVHGEQTHLDAHAALARKAGVGRTLVGRNGDLYMIRPVPGIRRQLVATGRLGYRQEELVRVV